MHIKSNYKILLKVLNYKNFTNTILKYKSSIFKVLLAFSIIFYLIYEGRLDILSVRELYDYPVKTLLLLTIFFIGSIVVATVRWWLFVNFIQSGFSFFHLLRITLQSTFLSLIMPGGASLDIVKSFLLIKFEGFTQKTDLAVTVVVDRLVGVIALLLVVVVTSLFHLDIFQNANLHTFILIMGCLLGFLVIFLFILLGPFTRSANLVIKLSYRLPTKLPGQIIEAIVKYRNQKQLLLFAFFLSLVIQFLIIYMFYIIFSILGYNAINTVFLFIFVPFGMLVTLLPIGPAGVGAGYLGFDFLFSLVGVNHGADAYNFFVLIQLSISVFSALSLIGSGKLKNITRDELKQTSKI